MCWFPENTLTQINPFSVSIGLLRERGLQTHVQKFTFHCVWKEPRSLATLRARASTSGVYCCVGFSEQGILRRVEDQPTSAGCGNPGSSSTLEDRQTERQRDKQEIQLFSTVSVHALTHSKPHCFHRLLATHIHCFARVVG